MFMPAKAAQQVVSSKRLLFLVGLGWMFDAMDVGLLSFLFAVLKQEWHLSTAQLGWIGSINALGMAVGALIFGWLADRYGRKSIFMLTMTLFSLGSGLSALANGFTMFIFLRFFIGMGLGGELPVAATYVLERVPAQHRARTVVLLESFWAIGWIIAAVVAYYVIPPLGWRFALFLCALPAFYALYVRQELPDDLITSDIPKRSVAATLKALWSPQYRRPTLMLWILWFTIVLSYYGMFLWLPSIMLGKGFGLIKSFEYVLLMSLAQLPGYFSAAWLIERIGRKFVLISYLVGTALAALAFGQATSISGLLIAGAFLSFFNLGAWGALYAYTPEQYPADIRASGSGAAAAFGRLGGLLGPLAVPWMLHLQWTSASIFMFFTATVLVGVAALAYYGVETKPDKI